MGDFDAFAAKAVGELEVAAGIGGGDAGGVGAFDVGDFAGEELRGLLGLGDVVDAGAAAAPVALG